MLLLDTNVISELRKVRHLRTDSHFVTWAETLQWSDLYLSVMTIHELEAGIGQLEKRDPAQGLLLRAWLDNRVMTKFDGRILPIDSTIAIRSAQLQVVRTHEVEDALIGATALVHRMTLVTRNEADFADMGVRLLNPWKPTSRLP